MTDQVLSKCHSTKAETNGCFFPDGFGIRSGGRQAMRAVGSVEVGWVRSREL